MLFCAEISDFRIIHNVLRSIAVKDVSVIINKLLFYNYTNLNFSIVY